MVLGTYNVGNIRANPANDWLGKTTAPGAAWESFDTPENGVRAIAKLLQGYGRQGVNTLENIIGRYSPPHENRTPKLIEAAERRTGYAPGQVLDLSDPAVINSLTQAIIEQEQGRVTLPSEVIERGVSAAMQPTAQEGNRMPNRLSFASPGGDMPALGPLSGQPGWEPMYPDPLGGPSDLAPPGRSIPSYTPPQQPASRPPGLLGGTDRTEELLAQMTGLLGNGNLPPPDRMQHMLGGALQGVMPLMGPQREKVSPWQVLAAAGAGLAGGGQGYRQAQQEYRGQQVQDVGGRLKVEEMRAGEQARQRMLGASVAFADQLDGQGHRDLAAAVRNNPALMDEVLQAMAAGRFGRDANGNFTLGPGMKRFDSQNRVVAEVPADTTSPRRQVQHITTADGVFRVEDDGTYARIGASETGLDTPQAGGTPADAPALAAQVGVPVPQSSPFDNPNLSVRGRNNLAQTLQRQAEKRFEANDEAAAGAALSRQLVERFLQLNAKVTTGGLGGGPLVGAVRGMFDSEIREMQSITARLAPLMRQPGTGATSDYDAQQFERATLGIDKPLEANRSLSRAYTAAAENLTGRAEFERAYFEAWGHLNGADAAWRRYLNANPIFDPKGSPTEPRLNDGRVDWRTFFRREMGAEKAPAPPPEGGYRAPISGEDPNIPPPPPGAVVVQ